MLCGSRDNLGSLQSSFPFHGAAPTYGPRKPTYAGRFSYRPPLAQFPWTGRLDAAADLPALALSELLRPAGSSFGGAAFVADVRIAL